MPYPTNISSSPITVTYPSLESIQKTRSYPEPLTAVYHTASISAYLSSNIQNGIWEYDTAESYEGNQWLYR